MIIHSPIISGSLTFADGATFAFPAGGVYSGSFSGSYQGPTFTGGTFNGQINSTNGVVSGSSQVSYVGLSNIPAGIVSSSAQIDNLFNLDNVVSSSAQVTSLLPTGTVSGSSQVVSILGPLNTFSASQDTKNSTLATYTASLETKNSTLATTTGSLISSASNIALSQSINDTKFGTLSTYTASVNTSFSTQDTKNSTLSTYTASLETKNTTLQSFTASQEAKDSTLASYTASNDTKWTTLGSLSGSFARTNSTNIFTGNQTITGSLFISQDLVVAGSSSIQNISSSALTIGTAYVTLNTFSPSSRYAGLNFIDSGSAGGSGSLFYDSVDDEIIFVHKGNGTNVTSSHAIMGPETYDNLGNETYLTRNKIPKSAGYEHLGDSNITDTGTLITLGSNSVVSGTFYATGTALVSGSSQITYASISSIPAGIVSGSSQITLSSTTGGGTTAAVQFGSLGIGMAASVTAGRIDATNDIVAYSSSDIRFKENITPIETPLDKISKIGGYTYDWKQENHVEHGYEGNDVGVIAQEIETVLPQLVQTRESGYKAVKYDKLVALLIEGIKEQQKQIDELTSKVNVLENKI